MNEYKSPNIALWNGNIPHILAVKKMITLLNTEFDGLLLKCQLMTFSMTPMIYILHN
jgi:hypothetical protein